MKALVSMMRADEPHPQIQTFLEETEDAPAFHEMPVEEARAITDDVFAVDDPRPVGEVIDRPINGPERDLPIRVYLPEGNGPFAVAMFFHGGGFVAGSLESHDQLCRALVDATGIAVIAVDYRLAPEHAFPAAVEDAYAATEWVAENAAEFDGDPDRLAVVGDSSGGNLAAVVAQMACDRDGPDIAHQILVYPAVSHDREWPSYDENGEGYFVAREDLEWFKNHYFDHEIATKNVYASPILTADLEGLPPATLVTSGFDPLRDEGIAYGDRLEEAGVDVTHHHYDDAIHVFLQLATDPFGFEPSKEALDDIAADLESALK